MKPRTPSSNEIIHCIDSVLNERRDRQRIDDDGPAPFWTQLEGRVIGSIGACHSRWQRAAAAGTPASHANPAMRGF